MLLYIGLGLAIIVIVFLLIRSLIDHSEIMINTGSANVMMPKSQWKTVNINGNIYDIKIVYDSRIGKILTKMECITVWNRMYVTSKNLLTDIGFKHESFHVYQWHLFGPISFFFKYRADEKLHGYACNTFEEEARAYAGQSSQCPLTK